MSNTAVIVSTVAVIAVVVAVGHWSVHRAGRRPPGHHEHRVRRRRFRR